LVVSVAVSSVAGAAASLSAATVQKRNKVIARQFFLKLAQAGLNVTCSPV